MARRSILKAVAWFGRLLFAVNLVIAHAANGQDASNIDDLITKGEYVEAGRVLKNRLSRMSFVPDSNVGLFLAYLGKIDVEVGRLNDAADALKKAAAAARVGYPWEAVVDREQAALLLARGEYDAAISIATKAHRLSVERRTVEIRTAYCQSIGVLAQLREGNFDQADQLARDALRAVEKKVDRPNFFAPRILYAACLAGSYNGDYVQAESHCLRGVAIAEKSSAKSRSLSLGYLALAESYLQSGDFTKSHEYGMKGLQLTLDLFGPKHQDVVDALQTLALAEMKQGKTGVAQVTARKALSVATELFGEGSPGTIRPARTLRELSASIEPGSSSR